MTFSSPNPLQSIAQIIAKMLYPFLLFIVYLAVMRKRKLSYVIALFLSMILVPPHLQGQKTDFNFPVFGGIAVPALDRGSGFYLGINPNLMIMERLRFEAQVSFARLDIRGSFLSGRTGFESHLNILAGARFYLIRNKEGANFFVNGLAGFNRNNRELSGLENSSSNQPGFSGGVFFESHRFIAGIAAESNGYLALKVGISLNGTSR